MWGVCQESLSSFNIKTNQLSLVYLTNTYWVVTEVPGTGKTGQCVLDILYFPSPSKRWKTETKGGEEGGELWGAGWRGKITEQKRKKRKCAASWLSSWVEHTLLVVSRGFPHGKRISVRGLWATDRMIFLIALFVFSPTFYDEMRGKCSNIEKSKEGEHSHIHFLESTVNISLY